MCSTYYVSSVFLSLSLHLSRIFSTPSLSFSYAVSLDTNMHIRLSSSLTSTDMLQESSVFWPRCDTHKCVKTIRSFCICPM